jgi:large subunit ribosomal protein L21
MYAVIKTGGKQYRVQPGDLLVVEKLAGEPGANVTFGEVLAVGEGAAVTLGAPLVAGASVTGALVETRKGDKIKVFKKIRRQGYRRTQGHRQFETVVRVTAIAGADGKETKWDGKVDLTTKAELNARSRNLTFVAPGAAAAEAKPVKAAKPAAKADIKTAAKAAQVNAPVTEAPATEAPAPKAEAKAAAPKAPAKAAAPKADAKPAAEKKAAPAKAEAKPAAKAAAPKAEAADKKAAPKKAAAPKKPAK